MALPLLLPPLLHLLLHGSRGGVALNELPDANHTIFYKMHVSFNVTCHGETYSEEYYDYDLIGANILKPRLWFYQQHQDAVRFEADIEHTPLADRRTIKPLCFIRFCHRCNTPPRECRSTVFQIPRQFTLNFNEFRRLSDGFPQHPIYQFTAELSDHDPVTYGCSEACRTIYENVPELPWEHRKA